MMSNADYLRKVIAQGRSSEYTKVGEIMTDEVNLLLSESIHCRSLWIAAGLVFISINLDFTCVLSF